MQFTDCHMSVTTPVGIGSALPQLHPADLVGITISPNQNLLPSLLAGSMSAEEGEERLVSTYLSEGEG
jgi:hypothetical protein